MVMMNTTTTVGCNGNILSSVQGEVQGQGNHQDQTTSLLRPPVLPPSALELSCEEEEEDKEQTPSPGSTTTTTTTNGPITTMEQLQTILQDVLDMLDEDDDFLFEDDDAEDEDSNLTDPTDSSEEEDGPDLLPLSMSWAGTTNTIVRPASTTTSRNDSSNKRQESLQ